MTVTTPFRELIKTFPDLACIPLNKSVTELSNKAGRPEYEINFEFIDDLDEIDSWDTEKKYVINRDMRRRSVHVIEKDEHPYAFDDARVEMEVNNFNSTILNQLAQRKPNKRKRFLPEEHVLFHVANSNNLNLLKHPLVLKTLAINWRTLGRPLYWVTLLNYIVFLFCLNTYALLIPNSSFLNEKLIQTEGRKLSNSVVINACHDSKELSLFADEVVY